MKKTCSGFAFLLVLMSVVFLVFEEPCADAETCADTAAHAGEQASDKGPRPGSMPLDAEGNLQVSEEDRCAVCAMRPINYPKFSSAIRLTDGTTFYFCGTGCMIKSWMHPEHYLGVSESRLDRPVVHDYFSGKLMDARDVKWVAGSDVIGPMGPALVPVSGEKEMEAFQRRHGGKVVFTLDEMDDAKWREITGKDAVPKAAGSM